MSHCPSHDWDRYVDEMDKAEAAGVAWWKEHHPLVAQLTCAILSNPQVDPFKTGEEDVVEQARKIAQIITDNAQNPY